MSCSLGISTGSSGVYSALVDTDTSTNAPGAVPAETRFVSADQANSNVGDLVRASIKLMTTQVTDGSEAPRSIGVSYRTDDQLASIRSSLSRSPKQVRAIPRTCRRTRVSRRDRENRAVRHDSSGGRRRSRSDGVRRRPHR